MAINFTSNLEQYTTINRGARSKKFSEFTSKKQLENSGVLPEDRLELAKSIKGTFTFALHEEGRYMAITIYKANAEKKYSFLILDLQERTVAEADSIKIAKAEILELVKKNSETSENNEEAEAEDSEEF